jgi:hypothetical protein
MNHWLYLASTPEPDDQHKMHLAQFDDYYRNPAAARTLCGLNATALTEIDETTSGFLTTCRSCRRSANIK